MYDHAMVVENLRNIEWALNQILKRSSAIKSSDDFLKDDAGIEKLDSICMQLINIGEMLKQVDKLGAGELLDKYPGIDWKKAKGMRDIISHHYFDIDAEIVYAVCTDHLPVMRGIITNILQDMGDTA
jgi:uncharacterized protein with HEPN domain